MRVKYKCLCMLECTLGSHFCAFSTTDSINCKYFRICWGQFHLRGIFSILGLARHPSILSSCPWQMIEVWVIVYFHVMTHNRPIPHGITEKTRFCGAPSLKQHEPRKLLSVLGKKVSLLSGLGIFYCRLLSRDKYHNFSENHFAGVGMFSRVGYGLEI